MLMEEDGVLPRGICRSCSENAIAAVQFHQLCEQSHRQWLITGNFFAAIDDPKEQDKNYIIFYNGEEGSVVAYQEDNASKMALDILNDKPKEYLTPKKNRSSQQILGNYKCPDCGKEFSVANHLNFHLKNTPKSACYICGVVLPKQNLAKHLSVHDVDVFDCKLCHMVFDSKIRLQDHLNVRHNPNCHSCNSCGKGFSNERALRAHKYSHTLLHCKSCSLSFENCKCLKYHQRNCRAVEWKTPMTFTCDHCGHTYDRKSSLRIHIIQKHLNVLPFSCHICGKRTSTLAHLRSHEAVHQTVRKIYQCPCGAKLRTEVGFQLHKRIHTGEKPYECEECGDKFLSASRRLDHIKRRHRVTEDMPHACDSCPARFVRPFELKKHYLTVHFSVVTVMHAKRGQRKKYIKT